MMNSVTDQSGSSRGDTTPRSPFSPVSSYDKKKGVEDSKFRRPLPNSSTLDPSSPASTLHGGHKFHEAFQMKQGKRFDLRDEKISEMMKSNHLDNAPTQSLLSIINGILDEIIERKNGEISQRVACLLRKVVLEIDRRISTQSEHLRTQNTVFKAREEKYQSRIKVLETLASGTSVENEIATRQLRRIKTEKTKLEEKKKDKEEDMVKLEKENSQYNIENSTLRRELEMVKKAYEQQCSQMQSQTKFASAGIEDRLRELEQMRKDASIAKIALEKRVKELEEMAKEANAAKTSLEEKVKELQQFKTIAVSTSLKTNNQELEHMRKDTSITKISLEERVELEEMGKEANAAKTTLEEKVKELQLLKKETNAVSASLETKNQELEQMRKDANTAKISFEERIKELEEMGKEANAAKTTLEEKVKELQQFRKETNDVSTSLETKNQELEQMRKDASTAKISFEERIKELEEMGKEANAAKTSLEEKVKELQQFKKETNDVSTSLETKNQELEQMRKDASTAKISFEERIKELEEMGKEANAAKTTLEEKVKELQQFKTETNAVSTRLETKNQELEQMIKNASTAKISFEERIKELEDMGKEANAAKTAHEEKVKELQQLIKETTGVNTSLEAKNRELEKNLVHWKSKAREMEEKSELKDRSWNKKELSYRRFVSFQFQSLQELRIYSKSIKQEILKVQDTYAEEFSQLGKKLRELGDAAENCHVVLTENQKLFNELQELKGNIRVYCRVRPFLRGQGASNTVVEHIGEHGELVVLNPTKPGKDFLRKFRFNKVYSPASTQADVFSDIKPLIRSVLDGYNVCIFAYGQTGSGKTYTMTGPDGASEEEWGVNYRALNDLFKISQSRKNNITYEVGVQMVEIYNEQVRDLLSADSSQKKLGILSTTQENGLAVPDASMFPVTSTSDVLELMNIGLDNRVVSATALNERSSRSHSIVTVHVRGKDLKTGSMLYGNLHLVDLAGSERVDRSEVTGDRLKEAQHINKSLSALGDVIFSLASKSSHVPYRNSKLTQLLQSSLGGRAKTLMFVQLNPDVTSYSESMSTLKFAERVSGVELGAAKSSKDGRDVKELMEQLGSLKDTIARKDDEIERLHLLKGINYPQRSSRNNLGESDDFNSETEDSQQCLEEGSSYQQDHLRQSRNATTDGETLASSNDAEEYEESLGAEYDETEGSIDVARAAEGKKPLKISDKPKPMTSRTTTSTTTRPLDKLKQVGTRTTTLAKATSGLRSPSTKKPSTASNLPKSSSRWS